MSFEKTPTLSQTIPIYNYLIDKIEDFIDQEVSLDLENAAKSAKEKLLKYYPSSDGLVYIIATSM